MDSLSGSLIIITTNYFSLLHFVDNLKIYNNIFNYFQSKIE